MSTRGFRTSPASTPTATPTAGLGFRSTSTPCSSSRSTSRSSSSSCGRSCSATSFWEASSACSIFVSHPPPRPGVRLAKGGPRMALSRTPGAGLGAGPDDATTVSSDATANEPSALVLNTTAVSEPIVVRNTLWQSVDPNAYQGSLEPEVTHLRESSRTTRIAASRRRPLVRRAGGHPDEGRLRPGPDPGEQPVAAPVGPCLLRDGDDVEPRPRATTWIAGACSRSGPRPARRTSSSSPAR